MGKSCQRTVVRLVRGGAWNYVFTCTSQAKKTACGMLNLPLRAAEDATVDRAAIWNEDDFLTFKREKDTMILIQASVSLIVDKL